MSADLCTQIQVVVKGEWFWFQRVPQGERQRQRLIMIPSHDQQQEGFPPGYDCIERGVKSWPPKPPQLMSRGSCVQIRSWFITVMMTKLCLNWHTNHSYTSRQSLHYQHSLGRSSDKSPTNPTYLTQCLRPTATNPHRHIALGLGILFL